MDLTRRRLLAATGLCALSAPLGAARAASSPATTVRLAVRIETTSDWSKVVLTPGRVAATRVVSASPGSRVVSGHLGWHVVRTAPVGTAVVELDAVFDDVSGARAYRLALQKGAQGVTTVTVRNTTGAPAAVATLVDRRTDGARDDVSVAVPAARLLGARQLALPRADPRRLTLAFAYPWFADYRDPRLTDRPADPRPSTGAGWVSMTRQARAAGLDGFVVSFSGAARNGAAFTAARTAAEATGGLIAPYLESTEARDQGRRDGRATLAVVASWLDEALAASTGPAALRSGAATVVFVWDAAQLTPAQWRLLLTASAARGRPVRLVTDALDPGYDAVSWGRHLYTVSGVLPELAGTHRELALSAHAPAALGAAAPTLYAATVSPGYDDRRLRGSTHPVVPRGARGERYDASWAVATASRPDWVLVNSWNEWYEGTPVEPGLATGERSLTQTARQAARWRKGP